MMASKHVTVFWQAVEASDSDTPSEGKFELVKDGGSVVSLKALQKQVGAFFCVPHAQATEITFGTLAQTTVTQEVLNSRKECHLLAFPTNDKTIVRAFTLPGQFVPHPNAVTSAGEFSYYESQKFDHNRLLACAIGELIDNALMASMSSPSSTKIEIHIDKHNHGDVTVACHDFGLGMSYKDLERFTIYALKPVNENIEYQEYEYKSNYITGRLSKYGVGSKQSAFYIGKKMTVMTKQAGTNSVVEFVMSKTLMHDRYESGHGEDAYKSAILTRPIKNADASFLKKAGLLSQDYRNLIENETEEDSFTIVLISETQEKFHNYLLEETSRLSEDIATLYHYYIHGKDGIREIKPWVKSATSRKGAKTRSSTSRSPSEECIPKVVQAEIVLLLTRDGDNRLFDLKTAKDEESKLLFGAADCAFRFNIAVKAGDGYHIYPGVLHYYPRLGDNETYPGADDVNDDFDSEDEDEDESKEETRNDYIANRIRIFWMGKRVPYTNFPYFHWAHPKKTQHEEQRRVRGAVFLGQGAFTVTQNKLHISSITAADLDLVVLDDENVHDVISTGLERGDFKKRAKVKYQAWLAKCHKEFDKSIKFDDEIPRQSSWPKSKRYFRSIYYGGRRFKEGSRISIRYKTKQMFGTVKRFTSDKRGKSEEGSLGHVVFTRLPPEIFDKSKEFTEPISRLATMPDSHVRKQELAHSKEARKKWPVRVEVKFHETVSFDDGETVITAKTAVTSNAEETPFKIGTGFVFPKSSVIVYGGQPKDTTPKLTAVKHPDDKPQHITVIQQFLKYDTKTGDFEFDTGVEDPMHFVNASPKGKEFIFESAEIRKPGDYKVLFYVQDTHDQNMDALAYDFKGLNDIELYLRAEAKTPVRVYTSANREKAVLGEEVKIVFDLIDDQGNICLADVDSTCFQIHGDMFEVQESLKIRKKNGKTYLKFAITPKDGTKSLEIDHDKGLQTDLDLIYTHPNGTQLNPVQILLQVFPGAPKSISFVDLPKELIIRHNDDESPEITIILRDQWNNITTPGDHVDKAYLNCDDSAHFGKKKKKQYKRQIMEHFDPQTNFVHFAVPQIHLVEPNFETEPSITVDFTVTLDSVDIKEIAFSVEMLPSNAVDNIEIIHDDSPIADSIQAEVGSTLQLGFKINDESNSECKDVDDLSNYELRPGWTGRMTIPDDGLLPPLEVPKSMPNGMEFHVELLNTTGKPKRPRIMDKASFTIDPIYGTASKWKIKMAKNELINSFPVNDKIKVFALDVYDNVLDNTYQKDLQPQLTFTCDEKTPGKSSLNEDVWTFPDLALEGLCGKEYTVTVKGGSLEPDSLTFTFAAGQPAQLKVAIDKGRMYAASMDHSVYTRDVIELISVICTDQNDNKIGKLNCKIALECGKGIKFPGRNTTKDLKRGEAEWKKKRIVADRPGDYMVKITASTGKYKSLIPAQLLLKVEPTNCVTNLNCEFARQREDADGMDIDSGAMISLGDPFPTILCTLGTEDGTSLPQKCAEFFCIEVSNSDDDELMGVYQTCTWSNGFFRFTSKKIFNKSGQYLFTIKYTEGRDDFSDNSIFPVVEWTETLEESVSPGPAVALGSLDELPDKVSVSNIPELASRTIVSDLTIILLDEYGNRSLQKMDAGLEFDIESDESKSVGLILDDVKLKKGKDSVKIKHIVLSKDSLGPKGNYNLVINDKNSELVPLLISFSFTDEGQEARQARMDQDAIKSNKAQLSKISKKLIQLRRKKKKLDSNVQKAERALSTIQKKIPPKYRPQNLQDAKQKKRKLEQEIENEGKKAAPVEEVFEYTPKERKFIKNDGCIGIVGGLATCQTVDMSRLISWQLQTNMHTYVVTDNETAEYKSLKRFKPGPRVLILSFQPKSGSKLQLPHERHGTLKSRSINGNPRHAVNLIEPSGDLSLDTAENANVKRSRTSNFRRIFSAVLGKTIVMDTFEDAASYKRLCAKHSVNVPTILTMDGHKIPGSGIVNMQDQAWPGLATLKRKQGILGVIDTNDVAENFELESILELLDKYVTSFKDVKDVQNERDNSAITKEINKLGKEQVSLKDGIQDVLQKTSLKRNQASKRKRSTSSPARSSSSSSSSSHSTKSPRSGSASASTASSVQFSPSKLDPNPPSSHTRSGSRTPKRAKMGNEMRLSNESAGSPSARKGKTKRLSTGKNTPARKRTKKN